jgi:hypothetical protein
MSESITNDLHLTEREKELEAVGRAIGALVGLQAEFPQPLPTVRRTIYGLLDAFPDLDHLRDMITPDGTMKRGPRR